MPGSAFTPATEAVRTMAPPVSRIAFIAACRVRKAPSRLIDMTWRQSAKLVSAIGPPAPIPALTTAWVSPVRSSRSHKRSSATSPMRIWRSHGRVKAKSRSLSSSRSIRMSLRAPASARRVAVAAPMPEAAPVMSTMAWVKSGMAGSVSRFRLFVTPAKARWGDGSGEDAFQLPHCGALIPAQELRVLEQRDADEDVHRHGDEEDEDGGGAGVRAVEESGREAGQGTACIPHHVDAEQQGEE